MSNAVTKSLLLLIAISLLAFAMPVFAGSADDPVDGMKGVNITGTPKSERVFSVMYLSLKTGLTEHQWTVFSPSNPSCK